MAPYAIQETVKYYRIVAQKDRSAHCFVVKEDFSNKTIGSVRSGDLMKPATYTCPAKHPRGNLFDRDSWEEAFTEWGMKYLR